MLPSKASLLSSSKVSKMSKSYKVQFVFWQTRLADWNSILLFIALFVYLEVIMLKISIKPYGVPSWFCHGKPKLNCFVRNNITKLTSYVTLIVVPAPHKTIRHTFSN